MNHIQEERERIYQNILNTFEKGEGDRGGKVIGHTRSGKPIYNHFLHSNHQNFTLQDHEDASDLHISIENQLRENNKRPFEGKVLGYRMYHENQANYHQTASWKLREQYA